MKIKFNELKNGDILCLRGKDYVFLDKKKESAELLALIDGTLSYANVEFIEDFMTLKANKIKNKTHPLTKIFK